MPDQATSINSNHAETLEFLTEIAKDRTTGNLFVCSMPDSTSGGTNLELLHPIGDDINLDKLKYVMANAVSKNRGFFINTVTTDGSRKRNEKPKGEIGDDKYDPGCHCLDPLTIVADYDKGVLPPTDEQLIELRSPLPTVRVKSGGGDHLWWFLKENSCSKELRNKIVERIAIVTHADPSMKSDTRILRLPGSVHLKNPAEPKLVPIVEANYDRRYTPTDFEQFLATTEPEPELKQTKSKSKSKIKESDPSNSDMRSFAPYLVGFDDGRGEWIRAKCPVHDGVTSDSLHINSKTGAFKCHKECDSSSIYAAAKAVAVAGGHQVEEKRKKDSEGNPPELWMAADVVKDLFNHAIKFETGAQLYWEYDGSGKWHPRSNDYIFGKVQSYLAEKIPIFLPRYVDNVLRFTKKDISCDGWDEVSNSLFMPFTNGILNLKTRELLSHSPHYGFTWQLPRPYQKEIGTWDKIDNFLTKTCCGDECLKEILIAYANAVLIGRHTLQKFLCMTGDGGNGKGALMRLLTGLVGDENVHSTNLDILQSSNFESANLMNKRLVIFPDEDKRIGSISKLKSATGDDKLRYEVKHSPAMTHFTFTGMVIISANNPIFVGENGTAVQRRLIDFPCNAAIPRNEVNKNLDIELAAELPAFTSYLLSLTDEWVESTLCNAVDVEAVKEFNQEQLYQTNSIVSFVKDKLVFDRNRGELSGLMHENYKKYCERSILKPKSKNNFSPDLIKFCKSLGHVVEKKTIKGCFVIMGVRYRTREDDHLESEELQPEVYINTNANAGDYNPENL